MMYADTSFQRMILTKAHTFSDLESTPLMIHFDARDGKSYGQVCFHLENAELAIALADAINGVLEQFRKPKVAIEAPVQTLVFK